MEIYRGSAIAFLFAALIFGCLNSSSAFEIEGKILVSPPFPKRKMNPVDQHREHCGDFQASQSLIFSPAGELKNAVIYLEGDFNGSAPSESSTPFLNQRNCQFEPHILLVPLGQNYKVGNGDPMDHDVRIFQQASMLNRFEMDAYQHPVEQRLDQPGKFLIRCGFHKWMHAYIVSMEHPYYAVSDDTGRFQLKNVPPGNYILNIWHESLGEKKIPLQITASMEGLTYTFQPPAQKT